MFADCSPGSRFDPGFSGCGSVKKQHPHSTAGDQALAPPVRRLRGPFRKQHAAQCRHCGAEFRKLQTETSNLKKTAVPQSWHKRAGIRTCAKFRQTGDAGETRKQQCEGALSGRHSLPASTPAFGISFAPARQDGKQCAKGSAEYPPRSEAGNSQSRQACKQPSFRGRPRT